ncbi:hypothetical protein BOTBODRAFT_115969 [Botryobasidium botryosum FD-172 SS1]|uniref:Inhibitor of apoptosis repeat-containing protein n=1 Tax=Botryobasidium botryosum (strain FD-172 SS1) TaxID=930990 RepID=A0A067MFM3_BOTB1|nr:hypothetical protein BOTBODRAFT_115969 [Botryobasidium botryosum FD-172 SS1]
MSSTASLIYSKAREESFQPPPAAKKSRASSQQSSSSRSAARHPIPWPHPLSYLARPTTLAAAGFWFDPAPSSPDRVTCYYCKKSLGGWEPNDDPAREHARRSQDNDCPWATVVCSVELEKLNSSRQAIITDSSRLPTNSQLEKARLSTFGRLWPHDSERGHQATSKRMAKAGWVYTPTPESDDLVSCFYCETFLDGWEPTDNPLHEHKRRSPHCAFFTARVQLPATNNIADGEFEEPVKPKKGKSKAGSSVNGIDLPSSQGQNGKRYEYCDLRHL